MMNVKAYKLGQVCNQIANHFIPKDPNVSYLPQLNEMALHQDSLQQRHDSIGELHKDPKKSSVNKCIRSKIAKRSIQKRKPQSGLWTSDSASDLQSQLSIGGASNGSRHQEMLNCQLQNTIQRETCDDSFPSQQVAHHVTASFGNSSTPHGLFDYSMVVSTDCNILSTNNANDSSFFEDGAFSFSKEGSATLMAFDGIEMVLPAGIRQVASDMVPSPEQISSITACSDSDLYSDTGLFYGGPTFPGKSLQHVSGSCSENSVQQKHHNEGGLNLIQHGSFLKDNQNVNTARFPSLMGEKPELPIPYVQNLQQEPHRIPESSDILPRAIFNVPISSCKDLVEPKLLMQGSQQFHQQTGQKASEVSHLPSQQSHGFQHVATESGAVELEHLSDLPSQKILLSYMNYKRTQIDGSQVSFVNHMHSTVCNYCICNCEQFKLLVSHFDNCHCWGCNICRPARRFCVTGKPPLATRKQENGHIKAFCDRDFSCISPDPCEDIPPSSKRLKVGNPSSLEIGVSDAVASSKTQPFEPEQLPQLWQWPEAPVPNNFNASKVNMVVSTSIQDSKSTSSTRTSVSETAEMSGLKPTSIDHSKEEEIVSQCPSEVRKSVEDNFEILNSYSVSVASEELTFDHKEEVREVRTESDQVKLETKSDPLALEADVGTKLKERKILGEMSRLKPTSIGRSKEEEIVSQCTSEVRKSVEDNFEILNSCSVSVASEELTFDHKEEREVRTEFDQVKLETKSDLLALEDDAGMKLKEQKILGVSLIDFFTVEEMKEHLSSLRQWIGQEVKGKTVTHCDGENSCQLCAIDKLVFAPATIYCSSCSNRIKRNLIYHYTLDEKIGTRRYFCTSCFKGSRGADLSFHGISISKKELHKEKNNHEDEESWVQCDKCRGWQHQICALYNNKRDLEGKAEYVCPKCYLKGIEGGEHVPLPNTVAFGAKEMPTTMLSDYIEQRLFRRLKQDREERGKALQKNPDEVPGAADLVVRVVLSVNKLLKVKQQFLDIFHDENYPTEFPYRSKVILLFQKIEGVDVCLFGMYVQEFGSECGHPNQRCVYVSYLDSVKYFRPEIKTASGEALRTFVYHEILIGYLDYCKKRGFATCYIWACPPLKGEDYILHCHPETQKTPKSNKLRQWYKSMLSKAAKENIVVDCTNLYDHFFIPSGEHNSKVTAARLPYFDGDYWSGVAVDLIKNIEQGSRVGSQNKLKKVLTKRTLKAMGHTNLSGDATTDVLLMQKLGQAILPSKEDFLLVYLQFNCTHCDEVILSGSRWFCNECKNFQLCERCHDMEQNINEWNTHTSSSGEKHSLTKAAVNDVPRNTEDADGILDNGYFDNRHSFLSFCEENHYQFDTLRRAKYSSMMILYHLRNSTELSVGTSCCFCHQNIVVNQGWHCEICPGFNTCDGCYQRNGGDCHIHKLSQCSSNVNCQSKNGQQLKNRTMVQGRQMLDLLMHATQCNVTQSNTCSYPNCLRIRKLFLHSNQCNRRLAGGCQGCQKVWRLLWWHSKICRDSNCRVPRCMELKKHVEMLALQSESRRRAAVVGSLAGF